MGVNVEHMPFFMETTEEDFEQDVLKVAGFTFVVFYRNTCSACKAFEPVINEFSERNVARMRFVRVPVAFDLEDDFRHKHGIRGEPTSIIYYNGVKLFDMRGAGFEPTLTQTIQKALVEAHRRNMCPLLALVEPDPSKAFYYLPEIKPPQAPPSPFMDKNVQV